ncbi:hypothetical protein K432DRAFT_443726 [Lepidopterella palustris CBS 459.81]|uniref:Uncharacterized protein n=1 Tax=Lepidopterella palustris CBS 459.81 TaxID=1314670 RepID=A0A8E2E9U9_9PEZI|nr:hypothetical protein K432DRAFT_443726 [Lepidopterella palustris CBS 459.81]
MHILSFLLSSFTILLALPAISALPPSPIGTSKRDNSGVYICSDINWGSTCVHLVAPLGGQDCIKLDGTASSIGPDQGLTCTFYRNGFCDDLGDKPLTLKYPGVKDLTTIGWNDQARSYSCVAG